MRPRTILYTGKGGVGKTSVAAATARMCARSGLRTVVLSTDPAHSLSDSLEVSLGPEPTAAGDRLWGQEVRAQREMEANWAAVQEWLRKVLAGRGGAGGWGGGGGGAPRLGGGFSRLPIKTPPHQAQGGAPCV